MVGFATLGTWALVRWGGLMKPSPEIAPNPVAANPSQNNSAPLQQAVLPFNNNQGTGAALPFAVNDAGSAGTPFNNTLVGEAGQGGALVPMFSQNNSDLNATAKHYLKQICGERVPTLRDWQQLVDLKLPGAAGWLHAPMGEGHFVMSMCLDRQNNLWVGTEGEGLYRFSPADGMWTQFVATKNPPPDGNPPIAATAVECGLGDNYIYALACDRQGRIWCGHLNHGISVFNGEKFQCYEVVGGLSRPDTLNGPLGERIFKIVVAPDFHPSQLPITTPTFTDPLTGKSSAVAGSVWMCTSAGLAIYFPCTDTWSYLTRGDGLPSDQANSLAFANDGTVYVATQCDGIAIASPKDCYKTWKQVAKQVAHRNADDSSATFTDDLPTTPTGPGLPSNLMNDILVANDGTVYAATTAGLAWSKDQGESWYFRRGADWTNKVNGSTNGNVKHRTITPEATLAEDYITSVAEGDNGSLYLSYREYGVEAFRTHGDLLSHSETYFGSSYVTKVIPLQTQILAAEYGKGLLLGISNRLPRPVARTANAEPVAMPASFEPSAHLMQRLEHLETMNSAAGEPARVITLSDDWITQGDWVGRYGRQFNVLCAMASPLDHQFNWVNRFHVVPRLSDSFDQHDDVRAWIASEQTDDIRSLYNPLLGHRRQAEWDDHGEVYPPGIDGPDIVLGFSVPAGAFQVSLYFVNNDGHKRPNRLRDYDIVIMNEAHSVIAHSRVQSFVGGVYKRSLMLGPADYEIRISRNHSFNTILSGVFADNFDDHETRDKQPLIVPWMGGITISPSSNCSIEPIDSDGSSGSGEIDHLFNSSFNPRRVLHRIELELLSYRLAQSNHIPDLCLTEWRWQIPLWTREDRTWMQDLYERAWRRQVQLTPGIAE